MTNLLPPALNIDRALSPPCSDEELDFVLPGLLKGTVGSLIGPGGLGKSYWMLSVLASLASGIDFCGLGLKPGRVVYLSAEDDVSILSARLRAVSPASINYQGNLGIYPVMGSQLDLMAPQFADSLISLAKGARLVVLDTLSRFHNLDENSSQEMKRVMSVLESIAANSGAAIVFLHHTTKGAVLSGSGSLQQAARGSSVLVDNARWVANLTPMSAAEAKELQVQSALVQTYVRWNISKQNYGRPLGNKWYQRDSQGVLHPVAIADKGLQRIALPPVATLPSPIPENPAKAAKKPLLEASVVVNTPIAPPKSKSVRPKARPGPIAANASSSVSAPAFQHSSGLYGHNW